MKHFTAGDEDACESGKGHCPPQVVDLGWSAEGVVAVSLAPERSDAQPVKAETVRLPVKKLKPYDPDEE